MKKLFGLLIIVLVCADSGCAAERTSAGHSCVARGPSTGQCAGRPRVRATNTRETRREEAHSEERETEAVLTRRATEERASTVESADH